jgi:beta-glucanase (GH16 family)
MAAVATLQAARLPLRAAARSTAFATPVRRTSIMSRNHVNTSCKTVLTVALALCLNACGGGSGGAPGGGDHAAASAPTGYQLAWSDEFDSSSTPTPVAAAKWDFDIGNNNGWGNNEREYYTGTLDNAYMKDGVLNLVAKPDTSQPGYAFTSARITNRPAAIAPYGYYEIKAKLPCGTGSWPALWFLGDELTKTGAVYTPGVWPTRGEIDVAEWFSRYFDQNTVQATVHHDFKTGAPFPVSPSGYTAGLDTSFAQFYGAQTKATAVCGDWHVYQMMWTHEAIKIGIDGYYYFQFINPTPDKADSSAWPFDNPQHLIMNVAVGGNLGGKYIGNVGDTVDPAQMPFVLQVDYVRIYTKP